MVEDDGVVLRTLLLMLSRAGHQIDTAANGHEALAMVRSGIPYEVIITDFNMPRMDGIQFLGKIADKKLPVIIHSATADTNVIRQMITDHNLPKDNTIVLGKPCKMEELMETISELVEKK